MLAVVSHILQKDRLQDFLAGWEPFPMEDHDLQDDGDLFEEIQARIEKEMFRGAGDPADEILSPKSAGRHEDAPPTLDDSKVKIVVEVDVVDSETNDPTVDESFLEEVDFVSPGVAAGAPEQTSHVTGGDVPGLDELKVPPPSRSDKDISSPADELADVQEDDLFLGELIDREMVGAMKAPGVPPEKPGLSGESGLHNAAERAENVDSKEALHTRTLAKLYADQGMYRKAKEIYEDLLRDSPLDEKLRDGLEVVNRQLSEPEVAVPAAAIGETVPGNGGQKKELVIQRLEAWLAQVQAEKETRCSKSS